MLNKYQANCTACGEIVAPQNGEITKRGRRWDVKHLQCGGPAIHLVELSGGGSFIQNANGRCEDAPCCGCCTN